MSSNHAREGGAINAGADLDSASSVTLIHVTLAHKHGGRTRSINRLDRCASDAQYW